MVDYYYRKYMEAKEEATNLEAKVRTLQHELGMLKIKNEGLEFNVNYFKAELERVENDRDGWRREFDKLAEERAKEKWLKNTQRSTP
jgi:predicted nuclease with TOPRIM domain